MKKIAIIGSGISGLTSAYLLSQKYEVTLFEKNAYIGGHTATVDIMFEGEQQTIDTGFIVFNDRTYPNFLRLLSQINIGQQPTEMSFSVRNLKTGLEYNGHSLATLFAQRRNLLNPKFWKLICQILRFNKTCKRAYENQDYDINLTLGNFLQEHKFDDYFAQHYILPMGAAIWSSSLKQMQNFQFKFFVAFFNHHGLLNITDRPQWYVIPGGSRNYIAPLCEPFKDNMVLNARIKKVTRNASGAQLTFDDGHDKNFDEVVFACHSDQVLELLGDASEDEKRILGSMKYSANEVVLHTDITFLPKRKKAWASWNYQLSDNLHQPASVTYNMNILQGLKSEHTYCVTLNPTQAIAEDHILRKFTYHHPVFDLSAINAQKERHKICGVQHTHFVGAYWYQGFHEDGVKSAVDIGKRLGCEL